MKYNKSVDCIQAPGIPETWAATLSVFIGDCKTEISSKALCQSSGIQKCLASAGKPTAGKVHFPHIPQCGPGSSQTFDNKRHQPNMMLLTVEKIFLHVNSLSALFP